MAGLRFCSIILLSALWAGGASAQTRSGLDSSGMVRKMMTAPNAGALFQPNMSPYLNYGIMANDANAQRQTLEALVGSSVEPLQWPQFPRVWWRFESYKSETVNTYLGLDYKINRIGGSTKHGLIYKYNRSISFVMIGSLRSNKNNGGDVSASPQGALTMDPQVIEDPTSGFLYPNVRQDYPMVGLCMYDLSMASENSSAYTADAWGSGRSQEKITGFGTPYTLYSNFFQLDPNKPIISHYVLERCQKMFETAMKQWVESQFTKAFRAYRTETLSSCKRERYGLDRSTMGDKDCFDWFSEQPASVRAAGIPRCERGADDLFSCTLKGKEGMTCPLRQDRSGKFIAYNRAGGMKNPSVPCDATEGLECVPDLPAANIANLEQNRLMLPIDTLNHLGKCKKVEKQGPQISSPRQSSN